MHHFHSIILHLFALFCVCEGSIDQTLTGVFLLDLLTYRSTLTYGRYLIYIQIEIVSTCKFLLPKGANHSLA